MILATLDSMDRYAMLNARLAIAIKFLHQLGPAPAIGRHEIDGESVYALVQRYETRPVAGVQLEAHRRYIDLQHVARGSEAIYWAPVAGLSVTMPYEPAKDVALFAASETMIPVPIRAGQCMILFPEDAHAPCCTWGDPAEVFKVVVKVAVADPR